MIGKEEKWWKNGGVSDYLGIAVGSRANSHSSLDKNFFSENI